MKRITLSNGLAVVLEGMTHMRSAAIGVFIKCGSGWEDKANNGISHFIEHLLFKGTYTRTARDISQQADELGGSLNAYTAEECICVHLKVLAEDTLAALDLVSDIVCHPAFDEEDIENEKKVILEEIAVTNDNPEDAAQELMMSGMFPHSPVGMPVLGSEENVEGFTRKDIADFYNKSFVADRMVLSIAGSFDEAAVTAWLESSPFAELEAGDLPAVITSENPIVGGFFKQERDIGQLQLVAGYPAVSRYDDDLYAFVLLAGVLAGDGSSRLFRRLREENGLVYGVDASIAEYSQMGVLVINTGFSAENAGTVQDIIKEEIKDITANGVTPQELLRAKRNMMIALELECEGTMSTMSNNGKRVLFGFDELLESIKARYEAVTNEDIIRSAAKAFSSKEKQAVALVGDCEAIEDFGLLDI